MRSIIHPGVETKVARDPEVARDVRNRGDEIVERAQVLAPKRTGEGAASIHAETTTDSLGIPVVQVSWDQEHDYMRFHEFGTEDMPAHPFLRPAADDNN